MARFTKTTTEIPVEEDTRLAQSDNHAALRMTLFASVGALVISAFGLGVLVGYIVGQEPRHHGWEYTYNQPMMPYYDGYYGYYGGVGCGWDTPVEAPMPIEGDGGIGSDPGFVDDGGIDIAPDMSEPVE